MPLSTSTGVYAGAVADAVEKPILISNQETGSDQMKKSQDPRLLLEIDTIIKSWTTNVSVTEAKAFLSDRLQECDLNQVCHLMRLLGKKSRIKLHLSLKPHLPAIASHLESLSSSSSSSTWSFGNISSIIYGLQCFEEEDDGYLRIVSVVTKIADRSLITNGHPSSREISSIIIGLQKNKVKSSTSREFLSCLTSIVIQSKGTINGMTVGNALYGLRCMSSDHVEVRSLLSALEPKVRSCRESLSAQAVGNAVYGLRCMSSDHVEVRSLLSALEPKVRRDRKSVV